MENVIYFSNRFVFDPNDATGMIIFKDFNPEQAVAIANDEIPLSDHDWNSELEESFCRELNTLTFYGQLKCEELVRIDYEYNSFGRQTLHPVLLLEKLEILLLRDEVEVSLLNFDTLKYFSKCKVDKESKQCVDSHMPYLTQFSGREVYHYSTTLYDRVWDFHLNYWTAEPEISIEYQNGRLIYGEEVTSHSFIRKKMEKMVEAFRKYFSVSNLYFRIYIVDLPYKTWNLRDGDLYIKCEKQSITIGTPLDGVESDFSIMKAIFEAVILFVFRSNPLYKFEITPELIRVCDSLACMLFHCVFDDKDSKKFSDEKTIVNHCYFADISLMNTASRKIEFQDVTVNSPVYGLYLLTLFIGYERYSRIINNLIWSGRSITPLNILLEVGPHYEWVKTWLENTREITINIENNMKSLLITNTNNTVVIPLIIHNGSYYLYYLEKECLPIKFNESLSLLCPYTRKYKGEKLNIKKTMKKLQKCAAK